MRKNLLMVLLPLLAVSIAFSVLVPAAQTWTAGGFAVHQEDEWKAKYDALKVEYDKLKADYETLLTAFNMLETLRTRVQTLVTDFEKLKSAYDELNAGYNELNANYISLSSDYESVVRQLNTTKAWMYFFILTTIVSPLVTIVYFVIRKRIG